MTEERKKMAGSVYISLGKNGGSEERPLQYLYLPWRIDKGGLISSDHSKQLVDVAAFLGHDTSRREASDCARFCLGF